MYYMIVTSTDHINCAEIISKKIIEEKISPCVQIVRNVKSIYHWKNKIVNSNEMIINIKTHKKYIEKIANVIMKNHNYDVPEIISFKININNKRYQNWFDNNIK